LIWIKKDKARRFPAPAPFVEEVVGDPGNELRISPLHTPGSGIIYRDVGQLFGHSKEPRTMPGLLVIAKFEPGSVFCNNRRQASEAVLMRRACGKVTASP
jgi:hypothetical protein